MEEQRSWPEGEAIPFLAEAAMGIWVQVIHIELLLLDLLLLDLCLHHKSQLLTPLLPNSIPHCTP